MDITEAVNSITTGFAFFAERMIALDKKARKYKKRVQAANRDADEIARRAEELRWEVEELRRQREAAEEWERDLLESVALLENENAQLWAENCKLRVVDLAEEVRREKRGREKEEGEEEREMEGERERKRPKSLEEGEEDRGGYEVESINDESDDDVVIISGGRSFN